MKYFIMFLLNRAEPLASGGLDGHFDAVDLGGTCNYALEMLGDMQNDWKTSKRRWASFGDVRNLRITTQRYHGLLPSPSLVQRQSAGLHGSVHRIPPGTAFPLPFRQHIHQLQQLHMWQL